MHNCCRDISQARFPVIIIPRHYLARSGVAYLKVGVQKHLLENFGVYPLLRYKIPNLGSIMLSWRQLSHWKKKCYSWHTKDKNTFSMNSFSNSVTFSGWWPPCFLCHVQTACWVMLFLITRLYKLDTYCVVDIVICCVLSASSSWLIKLLNILNIFIQLLLTDTGSLLYQSNNFFVTLWP